MYSTFDNRLELDYHLRALINSIPFHPFHTCFAPPPSLLLSFHLQPFQKIDWSLKCKLNLFMPLCFIPAVKCRPNCTGKKFICGASIWQDKSTTQIAKCPISVESKEYNEFWIDVFCSQDFHSDHTTGSLRVALKRNYVINATQGNSRNKQCN